MAETGVYDGSAANTFVGNAAHTRNDEEEFGLDGDWKFIRSTFYQLGFIPFLPISNPSQNLNRYLKSVRRTTVATGEWEEVTAIVDRLGAGRDSATTDYSTNQEDFQTALETQGVNVIEQVRTTPSETEQQDVFRDVDLPHTVRWTTTITLSELNTTESCSADCIANLAKFSLDDLAWGDYADIFTSYGVLDENGVGIFGSSTGGGIGTAGIIYSRTGISLEAQPQYFFNTTGDTWYYSAIKVSLTAQAPICIYTDKQSFLGEAVGWSEGGQIVSCLPFSSDDTAEGVLEVITIPPPVESGKDRYFTYPYVKINGGAPTCCGQ